MLKIKNPEVITVSIERTSRLRRIHLDIEIIPKNPTEEILLQTEEIPPLDVFYSPRHNVVVERQRKKRKIDQSPLLTPEAEIMNMVWKAEVNPSEDLTKLSQYVGSYTAATMDKASEVNHLMREKDQAIIQLEALSVGQQQKVNQLERQLIE